MSKNINNTNDFTNLKVWQKSHQFSLDIYKFTTLLPKEEKYNLISQIKRSVLSIAANIAEGYGRYYYKENIAFCRKARGSLTETKNHLLVIMDLNFTEKDKCEKLINECDEIRRLINGYIRYLNKQNTH